MGETAAQTRTEIEKLRAQMSARVTSLRTSVTETKEGAQEAATAALPVLVGVGGFAVFLGVAVLWHKVKQRREEKQARARLSDLADSLATAVSSGDSPEEKHLRRTVASDLRKVFTGPTGPEEPLGRRLLEVAVRSAVTAAVPLILKELTRRRSGPDAG